jgi:hypothetical protein
VNNVLEQSNAIAPNALSALDFFFGKSASDRQLESGDVRFSDFRSRKKLGQISMG